MKKTIVLLMLVFLISTLNSKDRKVINLPDSVTTIRSEGAFYADSIEVLDSAGNYVKIPMPRRTYTPSKIINKSSSTFYFHEKGEK